MIVVSRRARLALAAGLLALAPAAGASLAAQQAPLSNDATAPAAAPARHAAPAEARETRDARTADVARDAGPTLRGASVGARRQAEQRNVAPAAVAAAGMGQAKALMFVGIAAFVAGALMENDAGAIFMVGGAAVGLYGLYLFLQ